jgi:aminoglycoside 2'-N-acetyltransferase I
MSFEPDERRNRIDCGASTVEHTVAMQTTTVEVCRTEDLSAADRRAVIDVCNAAHETDAFEGLFDRFIPAGGRHFLGRIEGRLVSHAVVTTRGAQSPPGPVLHTAFVDAVSTLPSFQRRGSSTAVMRRLGSEIDDYAIGCLQTDLIGFYERTGWERWRGPLAGRERDGLTFTPEQRGVMILRLPSTPDLDLDSLLTIERQPDRIWE